MGLSHDPAPRRRLVALCALAAAAGVTGLAAGAGDDGDGAAKDEQVTRRADPVARLSLERQVGELLVMSLDGARAPAYVRRRLARGQGSGERTLRATLSLTLGASAPFY